MSCRLHEFSLYSFILNCVNQQSNDLIHHCCSCCGFTKCAYKALRQCVVCVERSLTHLDKLVLLANLQPASSAAHERS